MRGSSPSYIPSVSSFSSKEINDRLKKVLVIGSGCAGLGAAWHLNRCKTIELQLWEADSRTGGHANTINVNGTDVDTGFMVYNELNYPNLCSLFDELNISGEDTTMGFSVSMDNGKFEWCSDSLSGLLATSSNIINPSFYIMMYDILRFNKEAQAALVLPNDHPDRKLTVQEFLKVKKFSIEFAKFYLIPMTAAIWSASTDGIYSFPAITLFTFLNNHLLLQVSGHINWKTPSGRSRVYVEKICNELGKNLHMHRAAKKIKREGDRVIVTDNSNKEEVFDSVVFACHPDEALAILGDNATDKEKEILSCFKYTSSDVYVHGDEALMPRSKAAWTSWNYIGNTTSKSDEKPVFVTYWLNKLQNLKCDNDIFVSLNPLTLPDPKKVYSKINYSHPQYTSSSVNAQRAVAKMQGENSVYFCGAWMGYGFHEDGMRSGLEVAMAISNTPCPWIQKWGNQKLIPAPSMKLKSSKEQTSLAKTITRPIVWAFESFCQFAILNFLKDGFSKGRLTFITQDDKEYKFVGFQDPGDEKDEIIVKVFKSWFWARLALEADIGLARSYIAGEWEVQNTGPASDGMTKFLLLLIHNMPNGKDRVSGGVDAAKLATAWIGTAFNYLWFALTMDNSLANSRSNIHAHYDLSNDLFTTFLDKDHLMYSCAIFDAKVLKPSSPVLTVKDSLENAQKRKIDTLLSRLEPLGPNHTLLDIGFGWGGICIRAAEKYGCKVHGITLSTEQKALAEERVRQKGLEHLITFELVDYRVFAKSGRQFDRIVSCEMIEAVGHNYLPSFFECIDKLLHIEGIFVMQAITMPDARYPVYVKTADFINTIIFPGGCCPSLSALLNAMGKKSTLHLESVTNVNLHYAETLRQWRLRFNAALPRVLELGFDDAFIRLWNLYFCYCEAGFFAQVLNLQIITFSRPGNPNMVAKRITELVTAPQLL